ncbi:hypothetical protein [Novosphingobium rosa]|uniref:hypothetical protein n=1 Tax=Novosphingobium rosa TaxID=76978 RepID=UPI00082FF3FC|nr:hypothetical protein [Novosphingobium rosa]
MGALRVGGMSLARHQLGLALALGCERIICATGPHEPEMPVLRQAAEDAGASFHAVPGVRGMLGLVSVADDVIAFAEGLLVLPELMLPLIGDGPCVLSQPIEIGLAAGFERLDINHASAGALRVPGRLIERLAGVPDDADPFSILQRVALQSGIGQRVLPGAALEPGHWQLVHNDEQAHAVEEGWFRLHTRDGGAQGLSGRIARRGVRLLGPALLHAGSGGTVVALAGGVLCALALVTGWFSLIVAGCVLAAAAWVLFLSASLFGRVERRSLRLARPRLAPMRVYGGALDATLLLLLLWNESPRMGQELAYRAFAPAVLLGLLRLASALMPPERAAWVSDRALLAVVLGAASLAGWLDGAILALALLYLGLALNAVHRASQLTSA